MRRLCTIEDFAKLPEAQQRDSETGITMVSMDAPEFGDSGRVITYTFSTAAVARDMHTVAADAWNLQDFQKNPVFLWAHDDTQPPIGRVIDIGNVGGKLKGSVEYADRDLSPFADMIFRMVKARYINAVSTSWMPIAWSFSRDKDRPGGIDFKEVDLLEISQVPLPALPTALAEARSAGIDTSPMVQWAEKLLDRAGISLVPRDELETLRRAARMPAASKVTQEPASTEGKDAATRALITKHKRALTRAPKVPTFRRGLYEVSQLCYTLASVGYCHEASEYEAALEGDGSEVPAMLGEALSALGEALKAMAVEEVDELLEAHEDDDEAEVETRALPAEQRAYIAAGKTARARAWRAGIAIARAGKALSASNKEKLDDAQGHQDRAMKHSRALGEHQEAVSGHLKEARAAHGETTKTLQQVGEHVRAAQEDPEKAPEHLKRAMKAHGSTEENMGAIADSHDDIADRHADVGDSHQGMTRCVKSAQRCVRSVVDGAEQSEPEEDEGKEGDKSKEKDDVESRARAARERRVRVATALKMRGAAAD